MQPPDLVTAPANANIDLRPVLIPAAERHSLGLAAEPRSLSAAFAVLNRIPPHPPQLKLTVIDGGRGRTDGTFTRPEPS
jgi:hypothetical protein